MFTFTVTYNGIVREIVPYNYDTVEIAFEKYSDFGAFMMLPKISKIELISEDYLYLKPLMDANKCDLFILTASCSAINYLFSFNFYSTDFDLDNCKMSINSNRYMPNFDLFLDSLEHATSLRHTVANSDIATHHTPILYNYTQAKNINNTISYLTSLTLTGWNSIFLTAYHNPLDFSDVVFSDVFINPEPWVAILNPFNNLFIVKSLSSDHTINAPFDMSLAEILKNLNIKLNLFWEFNENENTITIEHLAYFENGRQVVILPSVEVTTGYQNGVPVIVHVPNGKYITTPITQLDLTVLNGGVYLEDSNKITVQIEEFCSYENIVNNTKNTTYSLGVSYDLRSYYDCSLYKKSKEIKSDWDSNIILVEEMAKETMLLVACKKQPSTDIWELLSSIGTIPNHYFASGVLFAWFQWGKKMAKYKRILAEPELIAKSTIKNRHQSDVVFPLCCGTLDETKTIKTDLGEGYIDEYTLNTNGFVNVTLKYEDND